MCGEVFDCVSDVSESKFCAHTSFGRVRTFLIALALELLSGLLMAVWVNYWGQAMLKLLFGAASIGIYQTSYTIGENVPAGYSLLLVACRLCV